MRTSTKQLLAGLSAIALAYLSYAALGGPAMLGAAALGMLGFVGVMNFVYLRSVGL